LSKNCYAERDANRYGHAVWGHKAPRRFFGDKHWAEPLKWDAQAGKDGVRRRVFSASMGDIFEPRLDLDAQRNRLWKLIEATKNLDWLLLTKRPEQFEAMRPWVCWLPNVWLGVTAENQEQANRRIPLLLKEPARVRFVSAEPMLERIDLRLTVMVPSPCSKWPDSETEYRKPVHWVIVGGENGPNARPFDLAWARDTIRQCREAGTACFCKQLGRRPFDGYTLVGSAEDQRLGMPDEQPNWLTPNDPKGADPSEWPEDLRVREFPR